MNLRKISIQKWIIITAVLLLLIDVFCFNHILELRNEEPRRAIVSIEMMNSGNYLIPHLFGEIYYNKPPFYNWIISGSMKVFGTGEFAVRFPGVLSFILTGFLFWKISKNYLSEKFRLLLPFLFFTIADLLYFGIVNAGEIDLFYSLIVCLQALSIFWFFEKRQFWKLFLISYLFCAIGVLTKGIPSLAFQALTLLVYFIIQKDFKKLFSIQHISGIVLLSALVGGYLYYYSLHEDLGAFLSQQFKEASQRTGNESSFIEVILNFLKFPITVIEKTFPWSLLGLLLFSKKARQFIWNNRLLQFATIFIAANIIIYWTAQDLRIRYIYMFFPFFVLILTGALEGSGWPNNKWASIPKYIVVFGIGASGIGMILLPFILDIANASTIIPAVLIGMGILFLCGLSIKKLKSLKFLWVLIGAMLLGRLGYNAVILPEMSILNPDLKYREVVSDMIDHAGDYPIIYTGPKEILNPNISFFGQELYAHELSNPKPIPYQIPYYYAHETGEVMKYSHDLNVPNAFYLMYEMNSWYYPDQKEIIYSFIANTNHEKVILFQKISE